MYSTFVLIEVETLGMALSLGWKAQMRCADGCREGVKEADRRSRVPNSYLIDGDGWALRSHPLSRGPEMLPIRDYCPNFIRVPDAIPCRNERLSLALAPIYILCPYLYK